MGGLRIIRTHPALSSTTDRLPLFILVHLHHPHPWAFINIFRNVALLLSHSLGQLNRSPCHWVTELPTDYTDVTLAIAETYGDSVRGSDQGSGDGG